MSAKIITRAYSLSYIVLMSNRLCAFHREVRLKYYIAICNQQ